MKLKLYVWKNVLEDYTAGIGFAMARSEESARKLVVASLDTDYFAHQFDRAPDEVHTVPAGGCCYGGG